MEPAVARGDERELHLLVDEARKGSFPKHALLVELSPPKEPAEDAESFPLHHTRPTAAIRPGTLSSSLGIRPDSLVHSLAKTGRNPFAAMITIGRAPNNDVIVSDASISKFHAYFRALRGDTLSLFDVGSKNGTKLDDKPVTLDGVPPATCSRIVIGSKPFLFVARCDVRSWLTGQVAEIASGAH